VTPYRRTLKFPKFSWNVLELAGTTRSKVGLDSSVCIATRYWLDGPGIESRWGRDFLHPSKSALESTQPHV
jgi:hypothetical protein